MDGNLRLNTFDPITLKMMKDIRLMSRIDTKYVIDLALLPVLMASLHRDYYIQEDSDTGSRSFNYFTLYFDTRGYNMYHTHQNGKLNRYKIRIREYLDTHQSFLEIKHKSNKGITRKMRIESLELSGINQLTSKQFIQSNSPYYSSSLEAKLKSSYRRITLVDRQKTERLTIDYQLEFENVCSEKRVELPNLVIIELKMSGYRFSLLREKMQELHIKPFRISKYCLGTGLTEPDVKQNSIKSKILRINKLTDIIYD